MDKPKKAQTDEEPPSPSAELPPVPVPSAPSPFRPLSRRRRQQQPVKPVPAVERPNTNIVFDASPTTLAARLAKAGSSPVAPVSLAWRNGSGAPAGEAADADAGAADVGPAPAPPPDAA